MQPATMIGFGKYCGRTCERVHNEDRQSCEWVSRLESQNKAILEFQEFVRAAERREKRKKLEERERGLEENMEKKELEENEKKMREEKRKVEVERWK